MIDDFKKIIAGFKGKRVLVAGDLMLDEYIWCRSGRISPEAPAPVLDAIKSELMPGGSGNTAVNIISLGGIPLPVGVIGRDNAGREVIKALEHRGVSTSCIIEDSGRQTTRKTRIIANYRYMARIDSEDRKSLSKKTKEGIVRYLERLIPTVDAVIISDYRKGFVDEIVAQAAISLAGKEGIPVCVDSKAVDYSIFRGATVITPNNDEAAGAAGNHIRDEESLIRAGKMLLQAAGVEYVLIKRANKGMTLFLNENEHLHVPAIKGNVFDATGAGDTVIAVLTMALAAGGEIEDAALLSSYGAAVAISKTGTAPCSGKELRRMLSVQPTHVNKILSDREIAAAVKEHKEKGATIVFTNGCFDIIHAGHVRYLMEAKKCGDILIVGLNGDESVRSLKGQSRPFIPEAERAEILAALECVDYVTIFPETTPDALIRLIKPDFHIKGEDYKIDDLPEKGLVESIGGKVLVAASGINRSSSEIIGWIQRETRN